MTPPLGARGDDRGTDTEARVRRWLGGDERQFEWAVERFTPLLLAQARLRLGPRLRSLYDPEDLVQEVWAIALPKLSELRPDDGAGTPVLLAFLGRILLHRCNNLVRRHIIGKPVARRPAGASSCGDALARLPAAQSGAVTRVVRREHESLVLDAIEGLDEPDRQIVVMRGLERDAVRQIAVVVGMSENNVSVRYRRALAKLRAALPESVFTDLPDD